MQSFIPGKHASVSLLVTEDRILPLSLNDQNLLISFPFTYRGGTVPLDHPARKQAYAAAQAAVKLFPGLRGYVGVDLVLAGDGNPQKTPGRPGGVAGSSQAQEKVWLIEINPRLTTSYLGLRRVAHINLAHAIWQACCLGKSPPVVRLEGRADFFKFDL